MLIYGRRIRREGAISILYQPRRPGLVEAVRKGRQAEFSHFGWKGQIPDPQSERDIRTFPARPFACRAGAPSHALAFLQDAVGISANAETSATSKPTAVEELPSALFVLRDTGSTRVATRFFISARARRNLSFKLPPGRVDEADSIPPIRNGEARQPRQRELEGGNAVQLTSATSILRRLRTIERGLPSAKN